MLRYILARAFRGALIVFLVTLVVFVLLRSSGDPASILLPFDATPQQREEFRRFFGLDSPVPIQYLRFVVRAATGNFGESLRYRTPALQLFLERLPATFVLVISSLALTILVGVGLGILAAVKGNSILDHLAVGVSLALQSTPSFWLGLILILLFSVRLELLPTSGGGDARYLVLPSLTVASSLLSEVIVLVRGSMMDALSSDYIRTARAKGATTRAIVLRHAFRNALIPVVTLLGIQFGSLMGGAVVTETVFGWPGVGLLAVQSIFNRDFPVVQVAVLMLAMFVATANLLVDVTYALLDPRIRVSSR